MSHSKRNTSLAFFTSHERSLLKGTWGSQSTRLTRDSFLPFGSCQLCLLPSQDPVACNGGRAESSDAGAEVSKKRKRSDDESTKCHIFCRECILANLLAQKKELKRLHRERELNAQDAADADARHGEEARTRAVEDFERLQMGLEVKYGSTGAPKPSEGRVEGPIPTTRRIVGRVDGKVIVEEEDAETGSGGDGTSKKRKFELDEEELMRIAAEDEGRARQALSDERVAQAKARELPSFWIPAETPSTNVQAADATTVSARKPSQPLCPGSASETAHPLSLKTLTAVIFTEEKSAKEGDEGATTRTCPACSKPLTNASHAVLAKPCGHVVCGSCVENFVLGEVADELGQKSPVRCFVCSAGLSDRKKNKSKEKDGEKIRPGLVEISSEGTGFAGGGRSMVKKSGTAFQC